MSVEDTSLATQVLNAEPIMSDDEALGAIWDQTMRDNGAARDNGKFASPNPEKSAEPAEAVPETTTAETTETPLEGEGGGEEATAAEVSTPAVPAAPLPANWTGMDGEWAKLPAELQVKIAEREAALHSRMSEQGRQISSFKPISEAFEKNRDLYEGRKLPDGSLATPAIAVERLMNAQRALEKNPVEALKAMAVQFGVADHLAAALANGQPPTNSQPQQQPREAGLSPAEIDRLLEEKLAMFTHAQSVDAEISRWSKDKPLFKEIAEDDMVYAITKARAKLGETAAQSAVLDLAYDMAVHADPVLRAKASAAKAAVPDPKRTQEAKRATSINLTSTSSGKGRELSEEERLASLYDELTQKG